MISIETLAAKLKKETRVALFCHVRPDGDSLGSAAALKLALEKTGVKAEVYCADAVPERFYFLPELKKVIGSLSGEYSAFVAIDCAEIFRLGDFAVNFAAHKNTYSVDHHVSNTRFAKYNYVSETAANCENIRGLIGALGVSPDREIAELLLMGIVTDTGNFRHKNVTAETLVNAAEMLSCGADLNKIVYEMFTAQSAERAKLFGETMSRIRYFAEGRIAVATVRKTDFAATGASPDETEGFIDFVMGIRGVEVGACVMETEKNAYKVSFRSKSADVNGVASTFGGGGHALASGCRIQGDYEEVIDKITVAIKRYLPEPL